MPRPLVSPRLASSFLAPSSDTHTPSLHFTSLHFTLIRSTTTHKPPIPALQPGGAIGAHRDPPRGEAPQHHHRRLQLLHPGRTRTNHPHPPALRQHGRHGGKGGAALALAPALGGRRRQWVGGRRRGPAAAWGVPAGQVLAVLLLLNVSAANAKAGAHRGGGRRQQIGIRRHALAGGDTAISVVRLIRPTYWSLSLTPPPPPKTQDEVDIVVGVLKVG